MEVRKSIGLMGNPNSGKSSLFNLLTGMRQQVGNFPGVTVDKKIGVSIMEDGTKIDVIDFPGTYSVFPNSSDEKLVIKLLTDHSDQDFPDIIVYVADATQLERHMLFATQIIDLEIPMIFCLNMIDLLDKNQEKVNVEELEKFLKVPVIPISTKTGQGIHELRDQVLHLLNVPQPIGAPIYEMTGEEMKVVNQVKKVTGIKNAYYNKLLAHHYEWLTFLSEPEKAKISNTIRQNGFDNLHYQVYETMKRFDKISPVVRLAKISLNGKKLSTTDRIDNIITHRWLGPIIFLIINLVVFQLIFSIAEYPMTWIENLFTYLGSAIREVVPPGWLADLLADGVVAGLGGILVFIPQIALLFLIIAILEEVGYMARAVYLFDGIMQKVGLNGRSIVSLISSGACAIPAIMATRTISDWKERLITIMVSPLISCSARIPVYTILVGFVVPPITVWKFFNAQGLAFMGLYLLGIVASLAAALVFKILIKRKEQSLLMIELPQYRSPIPKNILLTVKEKVFTFIWEAGKVIFVISIILWFLASYGPEEAMDQAENQALIEATQEKLGEEETANLLASRKIEASYAGHMGKWIEPAIEPLGFDWKIGIALITSFAAREVFVGTMATIYSVGSADDEATVREKMASEINRETNRPRFDLATSLSLLIFYVFAMQCMSTLAVTKRETKSWKWPIIQFTYMGVLAYLGSLFVYQFLG